MIKPIPCSIAERIQAVCRYIEEHSEDPLPLGELASRAAMSRFHFARSFKAVVGVTPKQYQAGLRLERFKGALQSAAAIDAAVYDAGYGSASRVYERAAERLGMTPAQYRRGGEGVAISYATLDSPAGLMLIGATDRGVCFVQFGDSKQELERRLRAEYPRAQIEPMQPRGGEFARWVDAIAEHLSGKRPHLDLPLDIRATAFQLRVWRFLQSIPYGEVRSYGEVADAIGSPRGARAVAAACAANVAAIAIPCHRVIRGDGDAGGYRWGVERKRALIDAERARKAARSA